ncbi:MAG: TylF/MycF family methyltransferase [Elusimicrobia bacterium]|nr:TylF/MycF family methyltransferase [Candidatus Obscuribacterium magneticum]
MAIHLKAMALVEAFHLISRNGTEGDYIEFGVFQGDTFRLALRTARNSYRTSVYKKFPGRFIACDSFRGLPMVPSLSNRQNTFQAGQYNWPLDKFERSIKWARKNSDIIILNGWFKDTLTDEMRKKYAINKVAIVYIDCDLYESAVNCLEFLTPVVQNGTVLFLDDFFLMNGDLKSGEALALEKWLHENPRIKLTPFRKYGIGGMIFIVNISDEQSPFYLK